MRIVLVTGSLQFGGAEHCLVDLAHFLEAQGHEVSVITACGPSERCGFALNPGVRLHALGIMASRKELGKFLYRSAIAPFEARRAIGRLNPDVVIAFQDYAAVLTLVSAWGMPVPVIVSIRTVPRFAPIAWVWKKLRHPLYRRARAIVAVCAEVFDEIKALSNQITAVIPGPISVPERMHKEVSGSDGPLIMAMGRLGPEKGFDLLIQAFARCKQQDLPGRLIIWGEGPLRGELENLSAALNLTEHVSLPGVTANAFDELARADIFVLSSRFEGFPRVLAEAMMLKTAVIATDCPGGVRSMIQPGHTGVLVPPEDPGALADALRTLIVDRSLRARLSDNAALIRESCSTEVSGRAWLRVIEESLERRAQ